MIYFVIIIILFFFTICKEFPECRSINYVLFIISTFILVLFAGFRGNIEPDYLNYADIYKESIVTSRNNTDIELGYFYFNKVLNYLGFGFQWVVFLMAAITIGIKAYFFKKYSPNYIFSLLLFYCSVYFLYDFIVIRQAFALSLFFVALPYLLERQFIKYFVIILCASTIHISALVLLPFYFFLNKNFNVIILYSVIIICVYMNLTEIKVPLLSYLSNVFPIPDASLSKMYTYSLEEEYASISNKQILFALLFVFFKNKLPTNKMTNLLVNLYVFGILLATLLNEIPQFAFRTKAYFLWTDVILMVLIIQHIAKKYKLLKLLLYLIVAIIYSFTMSNFLESVAKRGNYIFPYKTFFDPIF